MPHHSLGKTTVGSNEWIGWTNASYTYIFFYVVVVSSRRERSKAFETPPCRLRPRSLMPTGPASRGLENSASDTNPSNLLPPSNSGHLISRTEQQPTSHDPTYTSPRHPSDARHEQTRHQERPKSGVLPPQQKASRTDTALNEETPSCTKYESRRQGTTVPRDGVLQMPSRARKLLATRQLHYQLASRLFSAYSAPRLCRVCRVFMSTVGRTPPS